MLAEAYGDAGQIDAGLAVLLAEALAVTENTGERCWEAEQYRLQGELLRRPRRCVAGGERVFVKPSRLLVISKPGRWSCEPL